MLFNDETTLDFNFYTAYGYAYDDSVVTVNNDHYIIRKKEFFSIPVREENVTFSTTGRLFVVARLGFIGQHVIGKTESVGRLSYIDGCSDSMLVYPPRFGDPSLNFLHFPEDINQSFHTHPSVRIGCVIEGDGYSNLKNKEINLTEGCLFCLEEQELHRFRTENSNMNIIAYHPDGEWGPTDENHTMLNRTYIAK